MKNIKLLIHACLLLMVANLYHSCQVCTCKTITCNGFNDVQFDRWFPYKENDLLVYKTTTGATDSTKITSAYRTEQYEGRTGGGYGCGKGCFSEARFFGYKPDGSGTGKLAIMAMKQNPTGTGNEVFQQISFSFANKGFSARSIVDTGFILNDNYAQLATTKFDTQLTLGSKTFLNTQTVLIDTSKNKQPGAYKFYFARDIGLVAWENYPDKTVWIKE